MLVARASLTWAAVVVITTHPTAVASPLTHHAKAVAVEVLTLPIAQPAVVSVAAFGMTARRDPAAEIGALRGPIRRRHVAVVVLAVTRLESSGVYRRVVVVTVFSGLVPIAVCVSLTGNTQPALAHLSNIGARHAVTGVI